MPWHTYTSEEGFPYYFDDVTGRTLWAAPNDWVQFHDAADNAVYTRNAITGELRRLTTLLPPKAFPLPTAFPLDAAAYTDAQAGWQRGRAAPVQPRPLQQFDPSRYLSVEDTPPLPGPPPTTATATSRGAAAAAVQPAVQPAPFLVPHSHKGQGTHKSERRARAEKAILAARASLRYPRDLSALSASTAGGGGGAEQYWSSPDTLEGPAGRGGQEEGEEEEESASSEAGERARGPVQPGWRYEAPPPVAKPRHAASSAGKGGRDRAQDHSGEEGESSSVSEEEDIALSDLVRHGFRMHASAHTGRRVPAAASSVRSNIGVGAVAPPSADLLASRAAHFRYEEGDVEGDYEGAEGSASRPRHAGEEGERGLPSLPPSALSTAAWVSSLAATAGHVATYVASMAAGSTAAPHTRRPAAARLHDGAPALVASAQAEGAPLPLAQLAREALHGVVQLLHRGAQEEGGSNATGGGGAAAQQVPQGPKQAPPPERDSLPELDSSHAWPGEQRSRESKRVEAPRDAQGVGAGLLHYLFRPDIVAASLRSLGGAGSQCAPPGTGAGRPVGEEGPLHAGAAGSPLPVCSTAGESPSAAAAGMDELAALCGVGKEGQGGLAFRDPLQAEATHRSGAGPISSFAVGRSAAPEGLPLGDDSHGPPGDGAELLHAHRSVDDARTPPARVEGLLADTTAGGGEASALQCVAHVAESVWQSAAQQEEGSYPAWSTSAAGPPAAGAAAAAGRKYRAKPYKVAWGDDTQAAAAAVMDPEVLQEYESLVQRMHMQQQQAGEAHPPS